jgi:hypothetical protein
MAVLVTAIHVFLCFRKEDVDARNKSGHDGIIYRVRTAHESQPSTVLPLLMTATLRAFTLASNEITLPSFHISKVTVSPG